MDVNKTSHEWTSSFPEILFGSDFERRGPRPLALHIAQAELAWRDSNRQQLCNFYRGINAYRRHPYRREAHPKPTIWERGGCKLFDFGPEAGWPLLVIPSLINRAYILDLMPEASMLDFLGKHNIRPLLFDWGTEATSSERLTLDQLILERMKPALKSAHDRTGKRPLVLGYCMGGTLATALACLAKEHTAGLGLLAAPWNFDQTNYPTNQSALQWSMLTSLAGFIGGTPIDLLQTLFAQVDPMSVPEKFAKFAKLDPTSKAAIRFVAIEDWLNDGTSLNAEITSECFLDWYGSNMPGRGAWQIDGIQVRPDRLNLPIWLAVPERDRIVPPQSALFLANMLTGCELIRPKGGHVSMVAGLNAENVLWNPLLCWLKRIAAMQKSLGETPLMNVSLSV